MGIRATLRGWLFADAAQVPTTDDKALSASGSTVQAIFGDTEKRIGVYNPDRIPEKTYDAMMRHFQVRYGMQIRTLLLTAPEWTCAGPDPLVAAYVRDVIEAIRIRLIRSCVRKGAGRGMAPFALVWERAETEVSYLETDALEPTQKVVGGYRIRKCKSLQRANVAEILVNGVEDFAGFKLVTPSSTELLVERGECFVFTHDFEDGNHWGEGDLRAAYDPWYRQQVMWDQWCRYIERFATPPVKVKHPIGKASDGTDYADLASALAASFLGENATATLPQPEGKEEPGWDVEFMSMQTQQGGATFREALEWHDRAILRAVLMPDTAATQQQDTGSLALSQTHFDVMTLINDGLLDEIVDAVNRQLVPMIVRYTFGADTALPTVSTVGLTDETRAMLQRVLDAAMQKGIDPGIDFAAIAERLGLPVHAAETGATTDEAVAASEARDALVAVREQAQALRLKLAVEE